MKKAGVLSILFMVVLLGIAVIIEAQQPKKVPRIGYLTAVSLSAFAARTEAFRQGLRELGYIEGKNILIEYRYADGKTDRVPALADELVRIKVDIIVTGGAPATLSAKDATRAIPIVMASGWERCRSQPGATRRKYHWLFNTCYGHKRKTTGASQGDRS